MQYHIITYGCQMNKSDSERIAAVLEKTGFEASTEQKADLIIVDACSIRQSAIDRIFGKCREWQKRRRGSQVPPLGVRGGEGELRVKELRTVLTGCVLASDKKKFADKFDLILDIKDIKKLPALIQQQCNNVTMKQWSQEENHYLKIKPLYGSKSNAFIPIMTGCNNFCAYCVVPYTRGREVSRPVEEILAETRRLVKRGYKEITLLGQNVNSYQGKVKIQKLKVKSTSQNSKVISFPQLLQLINNIPGNFKLRFITSHPKDMSRELIKTMAECDKVAKELHLPVQAGDNEILKKMNRGYTVGHYKRLVKKIRQAMPGIIITTDIIVGFPGETKKQFENTVKLCREVKFDKAYLARYSPRAFTLAAKLKDDVPFEEKKRRWWQLEKLINRP